MGVLSSSSSYSTRQPQQHPTSRVRPFFNNINRSSTWSSCSKMTKITIIAFLVLTLLTLVTISVYADAQTDSSTSSQSRLRNRSKAISRKKKPVGSKVKLPEATTTLLPAVEDAIRSVGDINNPITVSSSSETAGFEIDIPSEINLVTTPQPVEPVKVPVKAAKRNPPRSSSNLPYGCGECNQDDCSTPTDTSCPTGLVMDRCSCCFVCGALEGNRCYNASLNLPYNLEVGLCGAGMHCLLRSDLDPSEPREALCECPDRRVVCGSDLKTYLSECKLREAAHSKPGLIVNAYEPCVAVPVMTTPVENATVPIGEDVSMSCEVRGFPAPILHWEFLAEGSRGQPLILPGDDSGVVVVVRGGPEQMMTTSWIQIISADPKRQGVYFCVAKNTQGIAKTAAEVRVYNIGDTGHDTTQTIEG